MPHVLITLKEAAKLLKLSEPVIKEMIKSNIFQVVKKGRSQKIDRVEIEEWLANLSEREVELLALQRTLCRFQDYYRPENALMNFEADNKYEAIAEMSKFAKELKVVRDHRWLYEVVVAREELVSTAVGNNVAFLHPRHTHPSKIKKPTILIGRCPDGVDFDAIDNKPVKIFFLLLLHNDKQHLFSLSFLSQLIKDEKNIKALLEARTQRELHDIISNFQNN